MWKYGFFGTVFLIGQFWLGQQLRNLDIPWVEPPLQKRFHLSPVMYEVVSVGQLPAAIDWLWVLMLQDESIAHVSPSEHPVAFYYLDLATELDPAYFEIYLHGANWLAVIRNDIEGALKILQKGERFRTEELQEYSIDFQEKFWRKNWMIPLQLAYIYLFERDDINLAAEMFLRASIVEGAPDYMERLAIKLQRPGGKIEVGMQLIAYMKEQTPIQKIQDELDKKRDSLFLLRYLDDLNREFSQFVKSHPQKGNVGLVSPLTKDKMNRLWENFRRKKNIPLQDPFNGKIYLDTYGRVRSKTPMESIFGLGKEYQ